MLDFKLIFTKTVSIVCLFWHSTYKHDDALAWGEILPE